MSEALYSALIGVGFLAAYWVLSNGLEFLWNLTQAGNRLEIDELKKQLREAMAAREAAEQAYEDMREGAHQAAREISARADKAEAELAVAREALRGCWGQTDQDDRLHFVIAVEGLPASTQTPECVAEQVVDAINGESSLVVWRMGLPTSTRLTFAIDDTSRAALQDEATAPQKGASQHD